MLRARLADGVVAGVFTIAGQVELRHPVIDGFTAGGTWLNSVLMLLFTAGTFWYRTRPAAALLWMCAVTGLPSLVVAHDAYFWTTMLPLLLVVFMAARRLDMRLARHGWVLASAAVYADAVHQVSARSPSNLVTAVIVFGGGTLAGTLLRRHERQRDQLDTTLTALAGEQARRTATAAQAERNRIAAETHDVVAQAMGEMVLQVGAARMGLQAAQVPVPAQLEAAEATGRRALWELRRSLGLLSERPDQLLSPVPDLAAVDRLLADCREAGVDVRLERTRPGLDGLPPGLQLSIYRVLQEALTNVVKHAGRVRTDVRLRLDGGVVVLEVRNRAGTSGQQALPSGGHGLAGMRERVAVYDGAVAAGATPDGGWRLEACWRVPR